MTDAAETSSPPVEIGNADELATTSARETAIACAEAGIRAAHPASVIPRTVSLTDGRLVVDGHEYDLSGIDRVLVVGGGKAAGSVVQALEDVLGDRLTEGLVVATEPVETEHIEVLIGDHPVPTDRSVAATRRILELAETADDSTLVLAVITGGASALMTAPAVGIDTEDLRTVTEELLVAGADIHEINAVRKHLSAIKGGGLARAAGDGKLVGLVVSDVVGDDLSVIASGPTAADPTTFGDAFEVLDRYAITLPPAVEEHLEAGADGDRPETAQVGDPALDGVTNHVLANGLTALAGAQMAAADRGYSTCVLSSRIRGEASEAAKSMVAIGEEVLASGNPLAPPAVVLAGGECTVTVRGAGHGGPNLEFGVAGALEIGDGVDLTLLSLDTDGQDGGTDAAGALVDAGTVTDPTAARSALAANDTYPYLASRNGLVGTGPTGTNVNDLRVVVIENDGR